MKEHDAILYLAVGGEHSSSCSSCWIDGDGHNDCTQVKVLMETYGAEGYDPFTSCTGN